MGNAKATHPDRAQLSDFVGGKLSAAEQMRVETHVAQCDTCCEVLRSLPHESLVERMRPGETSAWPDETDAGITTETAGQAPATPSVPVELADHARYRIVKLLGAGGMGVVYQAEHRLMERPVALKVINRRLVNNQVAIERFHLEVKAAAKLAHRNIVTAFDAEQAGDVHFLVMEFVEGISLAELVQQRGQLSTLHACNFAMQAAQGLQHASEQGMVHRDIKPQNLMRTPKGTIKILDFGLARLATDIESARLTRAGVALGTADYIAPEQVEDSRNVDCRADIYSLGCTLYFLLAGNVPFPTGTLVDKVLAHLNQSPQRLEKLRPDLPAAVVGIVNQMMAKDPAERFQTPSEVVDALKPFGRPNLTQPASAPDEAGRGDLGGAAARPSGTTGGPMSGDTKSDDTKSGHTEAVTEAGPASGPLVLGESAHPVDPPGLTALPPREAAATAVPDPLAIPWEPVAAPTRKLPSPARRRRRILPPAQQLLWTGITVGLLALSIMGGLLLWSSGGRRLPLADPGGWVDLMPQVDPAKHAIEGQWQVRDGELAVEPATFARLALPYEVPQQYDLEVSFTRESGEFSVALIFAAGQGQATFEVDAWGEQHLAGFQNIDGQTLQQYDSVVGVALHNGRRYTALIQVRHSHVTAFLDGQQLTTYAGDGSNLCVLEGWRLPGTRLLGVGAYENATTFHRLRLRTIDP